VAPGLVESIVQSQVGREGLNLHRRSSIIKEWIAMLLWQVGDRSISESGWTMLPWALL